MVVCVNDQKLEYDCTAFCDPQIIRMVIWYLKFYGRVLCRKVVSQTALQSGTT